jgi:hypothetical protein
MFAQPFWRLVQTHQAVPVVDGSSYLTISVKDISVTNIIITTGKIVKTGETDQYMKRVRVRDICTGPFHILIKQRLI